MEIKDKKILLLSPHTDDVEIAMGGSIVKFLENGNNVFYCAFSIARESVPVKFPRDILIEESHKTLSFLGVLEKNITILDFPVRRFHSLSQSILEEMIKLKDSISPDIVFIPNEYDIHQDHIIIYKEAMRAFFKNTNIISYEEIWNQEKSVINLFITLKASHIEKKIKALKFYKSQEKKTYIQESFIHALAVVRGTQAGSKFAEGFFIKRWREI